MNKCSQYGFEIIVPVVLEDSDGVWVVLSNSAPWDADLKSCIKVDSVEDGHRVIDLLQQVHDMLNFEKLRTTRKNII